MFSTYATIFFYNLTIFYAYLFVFEPHEVFGSQDKPEFLGAALQHADVV